MRYLIYILLLIGVNSNAQFALMNNFSNNDTIDGWPEEYFKVVHKVDFEDNTIGDYSDYPDDFEADWNTEYDYQNLEDTEIIQKDSTKCMHVKFPIGTWNGVNQGISFEAMIPGLEGDSVELYLSYDVMWRSDFDFVEGGKIGGKMHVGRNWSGEHAYGPYFHEGGRWGLSWLNSSYWEDGYMCFYFYHHDFNDQYGGEIEKWSSEDDPRGYAYFYTNPEVWYNVTIRMVCNTVNSGWESDTTIIGNNDGFAEGYINGKWVTVWDSLRMRNVDTIGINSIKVYAQFGGTQESTAATRNEWENIDNYHIWQYAPGVNTAKLYVKSDSGRCLMMPETWSNATLEYE